MSAAWISTPLLNAPGSSEYNETTKTRYGAESEAFSDTYENAKRDMRTSRDKNSEAHSNDKRVERRGSTLEENAEPQSINQRNRTIASTQSPHVKANNPSRGNQNDSVNMENNLPESRVDNPFFSNEIKMDGLSIENFFDNQLSDITIDSPSGHGETEIVLSGDYQPMLIEEQKGNQGVLLSQFSIDTLQLKEPRGFEIGLAYHHQRRISDTQNIRSMIPVTDDDHAILLGNSDMRRTEIASFNPKHEASVTLSVLPVSELSSFVKLSSTGEIQAQEILITKDTNTTRSSFLQLNVPIHTKNGISLESIINANIIMSDGSVKEPSASSLSTFDLSESDSLVTSSVTQPGISTKNTSLEMLAATPITLRFGQNQWSEQLAERVSQMMLSNIHNAEIMLDPPELGPLNIRVSTSSDQTIVSFLSANPHVRDALDQQSHRLKEMLAEHGLNLTDLDVSDYSQESNHQENYPDGAPSMFSEEENDKDDLDQILTLALDNRVDYFV